MVELDFDFAEIDSIINARSLAIVGASAKPAKFGSYFTGVQLSFGFKGPVYLVNPTETEIMGQQVYPDVKSLPETPDLVYITIPAHRCMDVLRECAGAGVKAVIILAAGFKEIGGEGEALEREALRIAREGGFRVIGPNCFGLYNPRNRLTLLPGYDFSGTPGNTAFVSQSGGFSAHVGRMGKSLGIDFSAIVSYGNAADLDECDFLRYFARDPQTEIIAGYLEGARDGRKFFDALREAAAAKVMVLWKVGKSESSQRAVLSHTGSLAGSSQIWEAVIRQCGVIEASGVDELCDVLLALKHLGRKPGRRLLLSGGGGGLGTYAADLAEGEGLEVPPLAEESLAGMQGILNQAGAVASNPLDIGAPLIALPVFGAAMKEAGRNPTTDILVFDMALNFAFGLGGEEGLNRAAEILVQTRENSGKPVVVVLYNRAVGPEDMLFEEALRKVRERLLRGGIPVYPSMPRALRAISLVNG